MAPSHLLEGKVALVTGAASGMLKADHLQN